MYKFLIILFFAFSTQAQSIPSYSKLKAAAVDILIDGNLTGSATFVSENGYILTAAHLFTKKAKFEALDHKNIRTDVELIAIDRGHDLALLKVLSDKKYPFLKISEKNISAGDNVYHFGSAFFRRGMFQNGFVSEDSPSFEWYGGNSHHAVKVIHVSATMQPGTSGGPWVNQSGAVIGVQSGIMTINKSNSGMAYLSPLSAIKRLLKEKTSTKTSTMELVVENLWNQRPPVVANYPFKQNAVVIVNVLKEGIGEKAGLKKDDLIIALNGSKVSTTVDFFTILRATKAGGSVKLTIYRPADKKETEIMVKTTAIEERFLKKLQN